MRTAYKVLACLVAAEVVRVATVVALVAMAGFAVLGVLRVAGVLTFEQQIGWLALPGYVLLFATRVFTRPPSPTRATALTSGARS
jgi:hypothetical protein